MIEYKKASLFQAPKHSIIVHACNAQGVWGSGIAAQFKIDYPRAYKDYQHFCTRNSYAGISGLSDFDNNENHYVGWLITSYNYGKNKDDKETIKVQTTLALDDFCKDLYYYFNDDNVIEVYSNKFNSGLFAVPWEESEHILNIVLKQFPRIKWTVCDPQGQIKVS